jgi:hypothetical protein
MPSDASGEMDGADYGDEFEQEMEEQEEAEHTTSKKGKKKKYKTDERGFANADDFEALLDAGMNEDA